MQGTFQNIDTSVTNFTAENTPPVNIAIKVRCVFIVRTELFYEN
jgi:hypothetical protein